MSDDQKFDYIKNRMKDEIEGYEESLKEERAKARFRRYIGIAAGVGAFSLSFVAKAFAGNHTADVPKPGGGVDLSKFSREDFAAWNGIPGELHDSTSIISICPG